MHLVFRTLRVVILRKVRILLMVGFVIFYGHNHRKLFSLTGQLYLRTVYYFLGLILFGLLVLCFYLVDVVSGKSLLSLLFGLIIN